MLQPKGQIQTCVFYVNKYLCHMFKYVWLAVQLFFEKMVHLLLCSACCNLIQQMHVNSSTWDMLLSDMKADKPKQGYTEQPMHYMQKCGQATHWEMQPRWAPCSCSGRHHTGSRQLCASLPQHTKARTSSTTHWRARCMAYNVSHFYVDSCLPNLALL